MARRKSSYRAKRSRRTTHTKRTRSRHTRRIRRIRRSRRGGDGSIGTPYSAYRMMPLNPNQTLGGQYFSRANQIGGGVGGVIQPSGSSMSVGSKNGQMATRLVTGGRA